MSELCGTQRASRAPGLASLDGGVNNPQVDLHASQRVCLAHKRPLSPRQRGRATNEV